MNLYTHLTPKERECIFLWKEKGKSITEIACEIKRDKSTVSRELRRNASGSYSPSVAASLYKKRRKSCRPKKKLEDKATYNLVKTKFIDCHWSPEQISSRLRLEESPIKISYATIYRGIYSGCFDKCTGNGHQKASRKLRHKGKRRHAKGSEEKRGKIRISNKIEDRPQEAEQRSRKGDWEADTVIGKKGKACLVTMNDRKTRFLISNKAEGKTADEANRVMIERLSNTVVHTISPDRGKEFAKHEEVTEALGGVQFYFPDPHAPWQRGTNENSNGLLREFFPKGTDFTDVSEKEIQNAVYMLNMRPRKCLNYKTPLEEFYGISLHLT